MDQEDYNDLLNQKIGKLTVESLYNIQNVVIYNCKCDCGNTCLKSRYALLNNLNLSCGCDIPTINPSIISAKEKALKSAEEIIGQKFNRLTPIAIDHIEVDNKNRSHYYMRCKCECGGEKIVEKNDLMRGEIKSCGCLHSDLNKLDKGFAMSYHAMKQRCKNNNDQRYGGRGISYDESWNYPNNFKRDMYDSYVKAKEENPGERITLDRIDSNGNYCKENCRWATDKIQANNKSNNRKFKLGEKSLTASELIDQFADPGITYESFRNKLRNSNKYAVDDIIINSDIFRNEEYRATLYKPIRIIKKENQ